MKLNVIPIAISDSLKPNPAWPPEAPQRSYCCGKDLKAYVSETSVRCWSCTGCGTLVIRHQPLNAEYKPWNMTSLTPVFLKALRLRREKQATQIAGSFQDILQLGTVLDYGCGQGAFVQALLSAGFDAVGADISLEGCDNELPDGRFKPLAGEWALPQSAASTFCMLDVLEHCQNPLAFLKEILARGYPYLLVKVPMLNGPIGTGAQLLTAIGKTSLLRRLLLAEDVSPHCSFFTRHGLINTAAAAGFSLERAVRIADVGPEFPGRLRNKDGDVRLGIRRPILVVAGFLLETIAPLWSDTEVFLFRRG
jgi:SAM-dependent methyltransferase